MLFFTYTIIEDLVGPVLVHNLDHAFTGCVQKDIVSVRLGIKDVFHYMYNHRVFGWACAVAQSRPCLHWLCTKGYCIGQVVCHRCYSLVTIIEGLAGPAPVHNLDHAFTGCVQRILYRSGWASQVLFIT